MQSEHVVRLQRSLLLNMNSQHVRQSVTMKGNGQATPTCRLLLASCRRTAARLLLTASQTDPQARRPLIESLLSSVYDNRHITTHEIVHGIHPTCFLTDQIPVHFRATLIGGLCIIDPERG